MPRIPKIKTSEELSKYGLCSTEPRLVSGPDLVDVKCFECPALGQILFLRAVAVFVKTGRSWMCKECLRKTQKERLSLLSSEERKAMTIKARLSVQSSQVLNSPEVVEKRLRNLKRAVSEKKEEINKKRASTNMEKWGVAFPAQNPELMEKAKATNLAKYGHEFAFQSPGVIEKTKATNLAKYGHEFAFDVPEFKELAKQRARDSSKKKRAIIKAKRKLTNLERFGVESLRDSVELVEKTKATNLVKYGTEQYFDSEQFKRLKKDSDWSVSAAEKEIDDYVQSLGFTSHKHSIPQLDDISKSYEIDIFIPELNIGIEFNGLYWHSEAVRPNDYHFKKMGAAKKAGIFLIQIFEHEWKDRTEQVKSRLMSLLGKNTRKVGMRQCELRSVEAGAARKFIDENHIQVAPRQISFAVGVYWNEQLISCATFGVHHRGTGQMVLSRFCCLPGVTVHGALSAVSKYALKELGVEIISWCDLRHSNGNGYLQAGWKMEGVVTPDYFYIKNGRYFCSKQMRRKSLVSTPEGMTEHEHALKDGLLRVYDCGKIRFKYS
jgi:hypothetical protein